MESSTHFMPGQRVIVKPHAEINKKLAVGLKFKTIYTIIEPVTCPRCGNVMLILEGKLDPDTTSRYCGCGMEGFHPNAFQSARFEVVNLRVKYKSPVLI